jgi:hypothetical protein
VEETPVKILINPDECVCCEVERSARSKRVAFSAGFIQAMAAVDSMLPLCEDCAKLLAHGIRTQSAIQEPPS